MSSRGEIARSAPAQRAAPGWLAESSELSVRAALGRASPELADLPLRLETAPDLSEPLWASARATLGDHAFAKFAFSEATAVRIWREAQMLPLLAGLGLPVPRLLARGNDPTLVATERVADGHPLSYSAVTAAEPDVVKQLAAEIAGFLAELHAPRTLSLARKQLDRLERAPAPGLQLSCDALRVRLTPMLESGRRRRMLSRWCDWVDEQLSTTVDDVLVHGDLHPYNQLWDLDQPRLLAVLDLESCGIGEPEFDFRVLPVFGPGVDLLVSVTSAYEALSGRRISLPRVMAHHLLCYLGDAVWRTEAGLGLPEPGETPSEYIDEAAGRLAALGIAP